MSDDAVRRFNDSLPMNFERWHDGIGFDLAALHEMTPDELKSVRICLKAQDSTWRELEALSVIDSLLGTSDVQAVLQETDNSEVRLKAADLLFERGKLDQATYEEMICQAIRKLSGHDSGTTQLLLLAEGLPTEKVKQALLWASWNRTDASFFCAGRLIYLCGKAADQLAMEHRPMLFNLQPNNNSFTRQAAFDALCKLIGMELDTTQSY